MRRHPPGHRAQKHPRGFTLLEVLLAVVIFAGSVAVLSRLIALGLDDAEYSRLGAEAVLLLENRFAELDAGILEPASYSNETDAAFPFWTWEMEMDSIGDFLYRIKASARYDRSGSQASFSLQRYFFDEIAAEEAAASASSSSAGSTSSGTGS